MNSSSQRGFALPTVLIVSVVMFTILTVAVSAVTGTSRTMNDQFYNHLAREAAESGIKHAQKCLEANNFVAAWNDTNKLRPGTGCSGAASQCTADTCYVSRNGQLLTTYEVGAPDGASGNSSQTVNVKAVVSLTRSSTSAPVQTYTYERKGRTGGSLSLTSVAHGYYEDTPSRTYFVAITNDGSLRSVGANHFGQLSTGNTNSSHSVEMAYQGLPTDTRAEKVYVGFKSADTNTFVQMEDGRLYASGDNGYGQLGLGHTNNPVMIAQRYPMPNSPSGQLQRAIHAVNGRNRTFVIGATAATSDPNWTGNVYAQGECKSSMGYGASCTGNQITPRRVALPASVASDPNTKPVKVMHDGTFTMVLMQGGAVYGFGNFHPVGCGAPVRNHIGETSGWAPIRLGTNNTFFGASGLNAVDIDTDGIAAYIRTSDGRLFSAGCNARFGQLGSIRTRLRVRPSTSSGVRQCMDIRGGGSALGTRVQLWECHPIETFDTAQSWALTEDGRIYNRARNMCLDIAGYNVANGTALQIWTCNMDSGGGAQKFIIDADGRIRVASNPNYCVDMESGGDPVSQGAGLYLWTCNGGTWQEWQTRDQDLFDEVYVPDSSTTTWNGRGDVMKSSADWGWVSMLVDTNRNGTPNEVYSYGLNSSGQQGLGTGTEIEYQPFGRRFVLPSGVPANDFNLSGIGMNLGDANMLVVGGDGKVYGAGANHFCQLGRGSVGATVNAAPLTMRLNATTDLTGIKSASVGGNTSILVTDDNRLLGVGNNTNGQLGDGTTVNRCYPVSNFFVNRMKIISY